MTMNIEKDNERRIELNDEELGRVDGGAGTGALYYVIQKGDTLTRIANRFGTTIKKLMEMNPQITDPNKIYYNTKIRVK